MATDKIKPERQHHKHKPHRHSRRNDEQDGSTRSSSQEEKNESKMKPRRPNVLFIMCDEMRFPPSYETKEIKRWRRKYLTAQQQLKRQGIEFLQHYAGATACAPSRATIFTGQYPSLHGVSQTDGAAKSAFDPSMFWLDPNTVPDAGAYFKTAGYKTLYKGKWHISHADIVVPGTHTSVTSYDDRNGIPTPKKVELYLQSKRLQNFSFDGWVGPEPHGQSARNSGSSAVVTDGGPTGRDAVYTDEVIALIRALENKNEEEEAPWFLVASLVQPHDITLYGEVTRLLKQSYHFVVDPSVPDIPPAPNANDDLKTKPSCQASYRDKYQQGFQPTLDTQEYRQLYYSFNLVTDRNVQRILDALDSSRFADNTIVVFTSDHGDMCGGHNLFQKWFSAYQEAIHVPLLLRLPPSMHEANQSGLQPGSKVDLLTSHVDLLPTLLGLTGVCPKAAQRELKQDHSDVRPLVGQDLSPLLLNDDVKTNKLYKDNNAVFFMTSDNVLLGLDMTTLTGQPYTAVVQPNNVETILVRLEGRLWKYSRYYDNPQFWSDPGTSDTVVLLSESKSLSEGGLGLDTQVTSTRVSPVATQFELYNLTDDDLELKNLADAAHATPASRAIQVVLDQLLQDQIDSKKLFPVSGEVPGAHGIMPNKPKPILARPS